MKKLLKYGVTSLTLVALGAVATASDVPVIGATVVRAEVSGKAILTGAQGVNSDGTITYFNEYSSEFWITSEKPYIVKAPDIDGWELEGIYLRFNDQTERELSNNSTVSVEDFNGKPASSYDGGIVYKYVINKPEALAPGGSAGDQIETTPQLSPTANDGADTENTPTNDGSGNTVTQPSTGNNDTTSPTSITPAPQAPDLSPVREQLLAQIDLSALTDAQKGALAEQVAFAETAKELEAVKTELAKLTAPAPVTPADLSAARNQLLAQVDKSDLTDEQKGDLAVLISFAETAEDLDKVKAEFAKLTKSATPAAEATKATTESKNTLPQTGEASSLALTGLGLVATLASLGLAHRRKAD